ncbi:MAG: toll/interleukin-1 receptor domain-containing protein [Reyranella sp.]|nr:toll/interleukin-1 receptor domain-containing protein [Reyranella sp.]
MTMVLIVAGPADVDFAEEVRRATRGLDIEIARSLPAGERRTVLLVWSAAAPATAADVPTLIELWSQGRLVIVRRDDTALPLGLGDLDTVPPDAPARETAFKLLQAALAPGEGAEAPPPPPPPSPPPAESRAPMFDRAPAPAAMARSTRRWGVAVTAVVVVLLVAGGLASWLQMAALPPPLPAPPITKSGGPDEAAMRREMEAARRMQQELSRREERSKAASSSDERDKRAAAERAERDVSPPPPAAVAPSAPPPPPPPPPPPSSVQPTEDARIVDLERQIAELQRRLEAGPVDGVRPVLSEMPAWAPWAAGAGVAAVLAILFVLIRRRRPAAPAEIVAVPAVVPTTAPAVALPLAVLGESLFVSYAHHDRLRVDPLVLEIEGMGRTVWIDRTGMTGGPGWAGQIARAIKGSRAVVLMASPSAYASDQVVRELYLAMGSKKIIVPIELEPADLPDELAYILAPFQRHALAGDPRTMLMRALDKV